MKTIRILSNFVLVCVFGTAPSWGQTSVYPLGGQVGTVVEAEVRADKLKDIWGIVFDSDDLVGTVGAEREVPKVQDDGSKDGSLVKETLVAISITISATAPLGAHSFQLISKKGLSARLPFQVVAEPNILEMETNHDVPGKAQEITYPCVIQGRIAEMGNVDYYAFQASASEELTFEIITASGLIPEIRPSFFNDASIELYSAEGSWFDPNKPSRLEAIDESSSFMFPGKGITGAYLVLLPRLRHRFEKDGWYLLRVGCIRHVGDPDRCYQLRIVSVPEGKSEVNEWTPRELVSRDRLDWRERTLSRGVDTDWVDRIQLRTGKEIPSATSPLPRLAEAEPNDATTTSATVTLPLLGEGAIGTPDDADFYRLIVEAGQSVVFEIRTPKISYPHFAPWLSIFDENHNQLVHNLYRTITNGTPIWLKIMEPKMIYTFKEAGTYYLRIRDLTARRGNEDYRYQIVLRSKIPHIGETGAMHVNEPFLNRRDRITGLTVGRGKASRIKVVTEREEGFEGEIAIEIENLPEGVRAIPGAAVEKDVVASGNVFEILGAINKEYYRPKRHVTSLMVAADVDAATMETPQSVSLKVTPINQGTPGTPILIQEFPLMVMQ